MGRPLHDDRRLFELLCLEGAQAGLSWRTILHKRENYRRRVRRLRREASIARLQRREKSAACSPTPGIVRNRLKVDAFVCNARAYPRRARIGPRSFDDSLWQFTNGKVIRNRFRTLAEFPGVDPAERRDEQGSQEEGVQVHRHDDLLCVHAGVGSRRRPPTRVLGERGAMSIRGSAAASSRDCRSELFVECQQFALEQPG